MGEAHQVLSGKTKVTQQRAHAGFQSGQVLLLGFPGRGGFGARGSKCCQLRAASLTARRAPFAPASTT